MALSTMTQNALGGNYLGGAGATPTATATPTQSTATPDALGTPSTAATPNAIPNATGNAPGAAPAAKYDMRDYVNQINNFRSSGDEQSAYQMFNGIAAQNYNGQNSGGALDSALRAAWGANEAKNWINQGNDKYHSFGFDIKTGNMGNGKTLAGWDPSRYDPAASSNFMNEWGAASNSGDPMNPNTAAADAWNANWAAGLNQPGKGYSPTGQAATPMATGVGVQGDMRTPMSAAPIGSNPTGTQGSGLAGGNYDPNNQQRMPYGNPPPAQRPTNRFDAPSQPSSSYSTSNPTRNLANRPMTLGGGSLGNMGRPIRAVDV